MTPGTDDKREAIQDLLDTIEAEGWTVVDYDAGVSPANPRTELNVRVIK